MFIDSKQEALKEQLLSKSISPLDFLKEVLRLDQSSPSHVEAKNNVLLLEDPEIKKVFIGSDLHEKYFNYLSITHVHVGQIEVVSDTGKTLRHFKEALLAMNEIDLDFYSDWASYLQGTIAYLEKNVEKLRGFISTMSAGKNKSLLERFLHGLEKRGTADYITDYEGQK